jgi:hypothetical protein
MAALCVANIERLEHYLLPQIDVVGNSLSAFLLGIEKLDWDMKKEVEAARQELVLIFLLFAY